MTIKGRGTDSNPHNRFAPRINVIDSDAQSAPDTKFDCHEGPSRNPATTVRAETARSLISYNASPDIAFERSINPYRVITQTR